ncbi:hypothetical protein LEP1GSC202_0828 [Leptospira yanagawae serovar Saopaulo str. Sao Paulo = ATCC 700523]|uniref:Uncharacterized protein n=2 Tax=Leptospira yanagawae TaxID=293069 RepID=A0A5E8HEA0_9LEPT|nr:hypothetical protein LEP1GSC202_0828 [Leptospira yanagawae serovar Saopaulo str. Sao Paulo = ATCC 700523]
MSKILVGFPSIPKNLYDSMTPTRTIQAFVDAKKENSTPSEEVWNALKGYRQWNEPELIGLRNASGFYPEIYFEPGMDETISRLLAKFKEKVVPHKF